MVTVLTEKVKMRINWVKKVPPSTIHDYWTRKVSVVGVTIDGVEVQFLTDPKRGKLNEGKKYKLILTIQEGQGYRDQWLNKRTY